MRKGLATALVTAAVALGSAQPAHSDDLVFVSGVAGGGSPGLGGAVSLNLVRDRLAYSLRVASLEEFEIFGPSPIETSSEIALLVGRASRGGRGLSSASVGLGLVHSVRRGPQTSPAIWFFGPFHARLERTVVGASFEARTMLNARPAGVGLSLFGNLNSAGSFVGVGVTVQLGKLR